MCAVGAGGIDEPILQIQKSSFALLFLRKWKNIKTPENIHKFPVDSIDKVHESLIMYK